MFKNILRSILITYFLFVGNSDNAYAWGHLKYLNNVWGDSALIHDIIKKRAISYCIDIKDTRFRYASIKIQTEMALSLWLKPLEDVGIFGVTIQSTDCLYNNYDLKIEIGPDNEYPLKSAYQSPEIVNQHEFSLIKINSNYSYKDTYNNETFEQIDFESIVPKGKNLQEFLSDISILNLTTTGELSERLKLDSTLVYLTTYSTILHELGHTFGLCDLNQNSIIVNCDPLHLSVNPKNIQPKAIMNDATYLYLTEDDKEGIKSLFHRFSF